MSDMPEEQQSALARLLHLFFDFWPNDTSPDLSSFINSLDPAKSLETNFVELLGEDHAKRLRALNCGFERHGRLSSQAMNLLLLRLTYLEYCQSCWQRDTPSKREQDERGKGSTT